jgi:11beta/17beta-hydroxysteroid dehydrogenase
MCICNAFVQVPLTGGHVEEFAQMMVAGACRGDAHVKYPSWYDAFLLYRVFVPDVLGWTFHLLLSSPGPRHRSLLPDASIAAGRPLLLEGLPVRKSTVTFSPASTSPVRKTNVTFSPASASPRKAE